jgi:hypothetical protein
MHTVSELAHTGDVLACTYMLAGLLDDMAAGGSTAESLTASHPRLDAAA